ncbi:hypothetical protein K402DRAFT_407279 [Aulographum hederae CBS 113979]|uniref:Uncharacterized protein n=1 Tax=Aulographum hederae CBS 113979 TaxID=1176131 RepID=A0A6G1GPS8_9PEZI|nr:hypothetical protein K402DRAFT_407279 [Aulographum hederae CBS 113979]
MDDSRTPCPRHRRERTNESTPTADDEARTRDLNKLWESRDGRNQPYRPVTPSLSLFRVVPSVPSQQLYETIGYTHSRDPGTDSRILQSSLPSRGSTPQRLHPMAASGSMRTAVWRCGARGTLDDMCDSGKQQPNGQMRDEVWGRKAHMKRALPTNGRVGGAVKGRQSGRRFSRVLAESGSREDERTRAAAEASQWVD